MGAFLSGGLDFSLVTAIAARAARGAGWVLPHVKVVLIGEGADELFAGYSHYRDVGSGAALHRELLRTIEGLHSLGLQRVDRVASASGIQSRIPFLDPDVVDLGLSLPAEWKLTTDARGEKWMLRKAFEGWLPDELLWREKAQFGEGVGRPAAGPAQAPS